MGRGAHKVRAKVSAIIGATRNKAGEEVEGCTGSLVKSFKPSAKG